MNGFKSLKKGKTGIDNAFPHHSIPGESYGHANQGVNVCWCYYCNEQFHSEQLLAEHLTEHSCKKPFKCEKCCLSFMHRSTLRRHEAVCGGSFRLKLHVCSFCSRSFTYRHDLKRHVRNIHRSVS